MIIDCHGHYTTTPPGVAAWRDAQKEAVAADPDHISSKGSMSVSDDEIRESIETNQLRVQQERGTDVTVCLLYTSPSPRDVRSSRMPSSA